MSEADTVRHGSVDDSENWVQAEDPATGRAYWINQRTRRRRGRSPRGCPRRTGTRARRVEAFDANSQLTTTSTSAPSVHVESSHAWAARVD